MASPFRTPLTPHPACATPHLLLPQKARVEAQQQLEWTQWQVQQLSEELAVAQVSGLLAGRQGLGSRRWQQQQAPVCCSLLAPAMR